MLVLFLLGTLAVIVALWLRHIYSHWEREGIPQLAPSIPLGNLGDVICRRSSFGINLYNLYRASKDEFVTGIYLLYRPALLIKDADIAKRILTEDFHSFHDRGTFHSPVDDPLTSHLFNMTGDTWKTYRAKLTPSFTTGKLRSMMPTILVEGENLKRYMQPLAAKGEVVKMKCLVDRFALNIIGSVGFGLDIDTIQNPEHDFLEIEKVINCPGMSNTIRFALAFLCPSVLHFFRTYANTAHVRQYFVDLCAAAITHREQNRHAPRKDFMQLLLQLRNTGEVSQDGDWELKKTAAGVKKALSLDDCAAQTFLFYTAGFDTSSSALTYCLYEMVRNPAIKRKLQAEIDEVLERHNNAITYDAINEMKYLELCILESVRKYPTLPMLNRICTEDYAIDAAGYTIRKGTPVVISLMGFGRDAKYFPKPELYWPERFEEETGMYNANAFVPFGDGPRQCIGLRLGKMIAKVGLVQLLQSFDFESVNGSEIEFDNYAVTLIPKGGVEIRVVGRQE